MTASQSDEGGWAEGEEGEGGGGKGEEGGEGVWGGGDGGGEAAGEIENRQGMSKKEWEGMTRKEIVKQVRDGGYFWSQVTAV